MKIDKICSNEDIKTSRVTVIGSDGEKKGDFLTADAIIMAQQEGLDLVKVGGSDSIPVCRIMDIGKYLYEQKKKFKANPSAKVKLKEVKIGFQSDPNIVSIRTKQAKKFIEEGNRVKLTVTMKGREQNHLSIANEKCMDVFSQISDICDMEFRPKLEGRTISMTLVPKKKE